MKIGFNISEEKKTINIESNNVPEIDKPVRSVVDVRFDEVGREYPYYNDLFNLKIGDIVYVDGKLAGKVGRVISVHTNFKVSLDYYKRVIAKLDLTLHGTYVKEGPFMICCDRQNDIFSQFKSWVTPPRETPEKFFEGGGYTVDLEHMEINDFFDEDVLDDGFDNIDKIKFITLSDGKGHAFYKGYSWHQIDFSYKDGIISNLLCNCMCPGFCKHSAALCLIIKSIINLLKEKTDLKYNASGEMTIINRSTFYNILMYNADKITL